MMIMHDDSMHDDEQVAFVVFCGQVDPSFRVR